VRRPWAQVDLNGFLRKYDALIAGCRALERQGVVGFELIDLRLNVSVCIAEDSGSTRPGTCCAMIRASGD
jgi:hypothetical protein